MKNRHRKAAALILALCFTFFAAAGCGSSPPDFSDSSSGVSDSLPDPTIPEEGDDESGTESPESGTGNSGSGSGDDGSTLPPTSEPEPEPEPVKEYASYIKVTGQSVNMRTGAGTGYASVGSAEKGTTYIVAGKTGNWYKTYYRNQTVYIYSDYGSVFSIEKSDNAVVEDVIREGYKQLGVPYVYGAVRLHDGYGNFLSGFTKSKFDCSSLVQYVFHKAAGVILQTTTRTQVKQGIYIPRNQLSRGDCIYFTNSVRQNYTGVERIGHVAIYLGDNYILHTATDYARIEQISSTRWSYYVETRRFV